MTNKSAISISIGVLILIVAAFVIFGTWQFAAIKFTGDVPGAATKIIGSLLIVTLFLERCMAAINSVVSGARTKELEGKLRFVDAKLAANAMAAPAAVADAEPIRKELDALDGADEKRRLVLGFAFALAISAAGVRTLEALLDIAGSSGDGAPNTAQKGLLHVVDILLTSGLIAGGSNGLAELMKQILKAGSPPQSRFR